MAFERCPQPISCSLGDYSDRIEKGIWSSRLFVLAGLLLFWTVGWSGMEERKLSSFDLKGITDFVVERTVSLTSLGSRLKILAPLTARLASLDFLTVEGAVFLTFRTIHSLPLLGLSEKVSV